MRLANTSYGVEFYPDTANYGQLINVQCRPGFYRASDSLTAKVSYPVTADGLRANQIYCFADGSFASNVIEVCNPIRCNATMLKTDLKIPHVKPYESVLTSNFYNYTDSFTVNCSRGYVSYTNLSSVRSSVACGQNWIDKTMGEWQPPDLNTCTAVKCEPIMNVSIKCKQAGYFFEDRQFDKIIKCDLSNGSLISGQWIGIYGTDLNNLKTINCKPVSCLSDTLMPRSTDASTLIKTKSFKNNVTIEFGNGTRVTVEAAAVNIPDEYPYASVIAFQCTETSDTGVGEPIAYCKSDGTWNITQLPSCIRKELI
uniref:Sushi domain-containing protein n=1 Tax=Macrostomum lignano TaxID=282301 RepID=A0A1I8HB37_9PLAT